MVQKKTSVTIGIPVHNEAANITHILLQVLKQHQITYKLEKIIVVSDKSVDGTDELIKKINNDKIELFINPERRGKSYCLDEIIKKTNSDILVLLDADTTFNDPKFIDKICQPIIENGADLTSPIIQELQPKNLMQKILFVSMKYKKNIFYSLNAGDNVYTCHGRALAYSKKLYKSIHFADTITDDAFIYFFCKYNNLKYVPVRSTSILYTLPSTFFDNEKQSVRFFKSLDDLSYRFKNIDLKKEYAIPSKLALIELLKMVSIYPIILLYFPIVILSRIRSVFFRSHTAKWEIAKSSKIIESIV